MKRTLSAVVVGVVAIATTGPAKQAGGLKVVAEHKLVVKGSVEALAFRPDGKQLAVGEKKVHLFDVGEPVPKAEAVLDVATKLSLSSLAYSRDGKFLIVGGYDDSVRVWDVTARAETALVMAHRHDVRALDTSPDGKLVVSASSDGTTCVWKLGADGSLAELCTIRAADGSLSPISSVVFHQPAKGDRTVVTATTGGAVRTFTIGPMPRELGKVRSGVTFSDATMVPNADHSLWAINNKEKLYLVNAAAAPAGSFGTPAVGHKERVNDMAFSPDGRLLASVSNDGVMYVWDVATKAARFTTSTRPGRYRCVAFAPDAPAGVYTVAVGQSDSVVHLMKLAAP